MTKRHTGCIGVNCPICPKLDLPGYEAVRAHLTGQPAPAAKPTPALPCIFRGLPTGEERPCNSCPEGRGTLTMVRECKLHSEGCTVERHVAGARFCGSCPDRQHAPSFLRRFDSTNLFPGVPGRRFNCSILPLKDQFVFSWRDGWVGSEVWLCLLDHDFDPCAGPWKLDLYHAREANFGREDARLFIHDGMLHVWYAGVVGGRQFSHTSPMYARLDSNFKVVGKWYPHYEFREVWEKNWAPFSHRYSDGREELFVVYFTRPKHTILAIQGGRADWAYETETRMPRWTGGQIRGGAAPARHGDEFWHFTHDLVRTPGGPVYRTSLVTFEAEPPFRVLRYTPEPILSADPSRRIDGRKDAVVFPGGAVRVGRRWIVAHGVQDNCCEIHAWDHADLESRLVTVD